MPDSIALDSTRLQRLQQIPLWDFALAFYAKPGVEAACLTLQDEAGLDVCEMLFHCWLYSCGLETVSTAVSAVRKERLHWQARVTGVLRALRRDLTSSAASNEAVAALRKTIKQAELMAERENLQRWQTWALEVTIDEKCVTNIVEKPSNVAEWLEKKLNHGEKAFQFTGPSNTPSASLQALQTLVRQLDPHQGAR
ncbi:TIGR02444 family protein [Vreelandella profundi]|uniref:TIGR02444 family protein n=1 Tax=Vreelandella profundi TaxID=2852117 RepID=UPI001EF0F490|nr:TIGR02444 family protein [Halomonas profundi]